MKKFTIALILSVLLVAMFVVFSFAAEPIEESTTENKVLQYPEIALLKGFDKEGHIKRLPEREKSLSTLVYKNGNGTITTYMLGFDVKYVDADGKIVDISNKLIPSSKPGYKYENEANVYKCYIPQTISETQGILIEYGDVSMILYKDGDPVAVPDVAPGSTSVKLSDDLTVEPSFDSVMVKQSLPSGQKIIFSSVQREAEKEESGLSQSSSKVIKNLVVERVIQRSDDLIARDAALKNPNGVSVAATETYAVKASESEVKPIKDAMLDLLVSQETLEPSEGADLEETKADNEASDSNNTDTKDTKPHMDLEDFPGYEEYCPDDKICASVTKKRRLIEEA